MPRVPVRVGSLGWMDRGACRQADPGLFFPLSLAGRGAWQAEAAKAICGICPVRDCCLSYAMEILPDGIWAGTTQEERRSLHKSSSRRSVRSAQRRPHGPAA